MNSADRMLYPMDGNHNEPIQAVELQVGVPLRLWIASAVITDEASAIPGDAPTTGNCLLWHVGANLSQEQMLGFTLDTLARDRPAAVVEMLTLQCIQLLPYAGAVTMSISAGAMPDHG